MVSKKTKYRPIGMQVFIYKTFTSKTAFSKLFKVDHYSILIVNSGSLQIQIDDKAVTVFENELLVVPIQSSCEVLMMSEQLQICLVSFTSEFVFENSIRIQRIGYLDFYIRKLPSKICIKNKDLPDLIVLFEQLHRKTRKSNKQIFKEEGLRLSFNLFLYVLAEKYSRYFQQLNDKHTIKEKLVLQFFEILEMNCKKHHDVKYYAETLSMTPDNLTKIIKEFTKKTAKQFIVEAIVLEAKNLLRNEDLYISNIREELQFVNYSSFSKFFKRHTSQSPSQYRSRLNFY
ncbi:helix-turn-helix domain-containing protein [Flavobacterium collinsii]|uniref:HTH-type transcriptional activator RhaR n=1 Tax=Flavobacterium collinsii TaxID=1114861 RepID=A0ABN7EQ15_9FLAO|nr:helix-turn-helix domain-containing protein [Flavobacterium collinsii]CAA9202415.1 HTH-type transcriptional activator RhaR [Flavobacterium collinsii]